MMEKKNDLPRMKKVTSKRKWLLLGGGVASLAVAVFMVILYLDAKDNAVIAMLFILSASVLIPSS